MNSSTQPIVVHEILPGFSTAHPLRPMGEQSIAKLRPDIHEGILTYGFKTVCSPLFSPKAPMLSYRLMSSNTVAILMRTTLTKPLDSYGASPMDYDAITRLTDIPRDFRAYLTHATTENSPDAHLYAEACFWWISTHLLDYIATRVDESQRAPFEVAERAIDERYHKLMRQSSVYPTLDHHEHDFDDVLRPLVAPPAILRELAQNTRDIEFPDVASYFRHLRACCYVRAVVTQLLEDAVGFRFDQLHHERGRLDDWSNWFYPQYESIVARVVETPALRRISTFVSCIPYDLLAVLDMIHTFATAMEPAVGPLDVDQLMDDWAGERDSVVFQSATRFLHAFPDTTVSLYTDIKGMKFESGSTSDIDDALAILFLKWFVADRRQAVAGGLGDWKWKARVSIVVCDKEVAKKESITEIWPTFPVDRIFADKPTGVESEHGAVYQPATANILIGPVHPRTLNEIFTHAGTRLVGAVTASSGVNGAYSSKEFNHWCASDTVRYVRYDRAIPIVARPTQGGGRQRAVPKASRRSPRRSPRRSQW